MKNKILLIILLPVLIGGIVFYKNHINKNSNKITSLDSQNGQYLSIEEYLNSNVLEPEYGGKIFCVFHKYGSDQKDNELAIYLWVYCEEYYKKGKEVSMGAGVSMPIKLNAKGSEEKFEILNYQKPVDGEGWLKSVKNIFPEEYLSDIINGFNIENFTQTPREKAFEYYKVQ